MIQRKPLAPEKALIRLEELCARSEHCTYELEQKLRTWGIVKDDAEAIIYSLQRRRFVDDARFAASFVRDRYRYGRYGRIRIRMLLRTKRIDSDVIEEALEEIDDDEYATILAKLIEAKRRSVKEPESYEGRSKIYRYALSRGYEPALVSKAMSKS